MSPSTPMTGLVDLLGGEEVLLLLLGRSLDVGGEAVGDRVLPVEEHRVDPHGGLALDFGEGLPAQLVLREVELGRLPVALLPAAVEIVVADLLGDVLLRDRHGALLSSPSHSATTNTAAAPMRIVTD